MNRRDHLAGIILAELLRSALARTTGSLGIFYSYKKRVELLELSLDLAIDLTDEFIDRLDRPRTQETKP